MKVTKEQIKAWKKKYGEVFEIEVDGKSCYLHKPSRKTLSYASAVAAKDPLKFNDIMLKGCWIDGDEEIKEDDGLFLSVSSQLADIIEIKEASLKKL